MRTAAAIVFGLALSSAAFGANTAPSKQVLAEMGLGGMQILSDDEATNVRGMGFPGFPRSNIFNDAFHDYQKQVKQFHKLVEKFRHKIENVHHPKPHDMKPPKMPHGGGGKPW